MSKHVLIVGRTDTILYEVAENIDTTGFTVHAARTLADVEELTAEYPMVAAIVGAGLDLGLRLQIIEAIFTGSDSMTVHLKDSASGPAGAVHFVEAVLASHRDE